MSKKYLLIVTVFLLLTGCYSTGNKQLANIDNSEVNSIIVQGQTTKDQVRAALGNPNNVDFNSDGSEQWTYFHRKSTVQGRNFIPVVNTFRSGTNDRDKQLVILFDSDDIVTNYAFNEAQGQTTGGLIG